MVEVARSKKELRSALLSNDGEKAHAIIFDDISGLSAMERVEKVIRPVLDEIGIMWWKGESSLSQVYFSAKLCEEAVLRLTSEQKLSISEGPKVAVAALEDHHLLGSKVVRMMVQSAGQRVIDYGRMDVDSLVNKVCEDDIEYLLVSTLMLRSALRVKDLKKELEERGRRTKVIVGGAPFRFDWGLWRKVDADFTASSPLMALEFIRREEEL
ncbi:MAG: cobalamin B12-binding domain-containing protein [Methanomassiliicoccales archaeon]|nr:MAG: cobalamin B12-binding domain-containing protein [Methanomassiliicoccales archaeon]